MLRDSLYTLSELSSPRVGNYLAVVNIDASHSIFAGHFPAQPVLPGVCLLEMLKEILSDIQQKPLRLLNAGTIKYLKMVDPNTEPRLRFEIELVQEGELMRVTTSSFLADGSPNFKLLKATFSA